MNDIKSYIKVLHYDNINHSCYRQYYNSDTYQLEVAGGNIVVIKNRFSQEVVAAINLSDVDGPVRIVTVDKSVIRELRHLSTVTFYE